MIEQILAWLQSNPESAAATLAGAGVPAPVGTPMAGGQMPPVPTPRPAPTLGADPGAAGATGTPGDMSGYMQAFAALQPPTTARQPSASVQSVAPTFGNPMTGQFSQIMQEVMKRQLAHQQPMAGLNAALSGRR